MTAISDYDIGQLIGSGGFASVYRAIDRETSDEVAIKIMDKQHLRDMKMTQRIQAEIAISLQLQHPNIVHAYHSFQDDRNIYLVMELCENGNLYRYIKRNGPIQETVAARITYQLLSALHYLHKHHIIHRDLKLSNVLFDHEMNVKLCDFGLAVQLEHPDEEHYTICGTPNYIAPEIASQQAHSVPADVWSLGCIFYCMIAGRAPFEREDIRETLNRVVTGEYRMPDELSATGREFLQCLLHRNPKVRANTGSLLKHSYLQHFATGQSVARSIDKLKLEDSPLRWSCSSLASVSSRVSLGSPISRDTAVLELENDCSSREQRTELLHTPVINPRPTTVKPSPANTTPPLLKQSAEPDILSHHHQQHRRLHQSPSVTPRTSLQSSSGYFSLLRNMHLEQSSILSQSIEKHSGSHVSPTAIPSLWRLDKRIQPFTYITPKNNVLLHSTTAITYIAKLRTKKESIYHQLVLFKSSPLTLHVTPLSDAMQVELHNLLQINQTSDQIPSNGQLLPSQPPTSSLILPPSSSATTRYAIAHLPSALRKCYQFVSTLLALLPPKIPKLTLYLRNTPTTTSNNAIFCKCILMSNLPLPDFLVRFTDGIRVHYSLEQSHLSISQSATDGVIYDGEMKSSSSWCEYAPKHLQKYIITAQKAMQTCLVLSSSCSGSSSRIVMGCICDGNVIVIDDDK